MNKKSKTIYTRMQLHNKNMLYRKIAQNTKDEHFLLLLSFQNKLLSYFETFIIKEKKYAICKYRPFVIW